MKPTWVENARFRGEQDDDIAYWCRRTVQAIDEDKPLRVTPEEYEALRKALDFPSRTNGCSISTPLHDFEFPFTISGDFDTWPVEVIRDE